MMHDQCDTRRTVTCTFRAAGHHWLLAGTKLYCSVTEEHDLPERKLAIAVFTVLYTVTVCVELSVFTVTKVDKPPRRTSSVK